MIDAGFRLTNIEASTTRTPTTFLTSSCGPTTPLLSVSFETIDVATGWRIVVPNFAVYSLMPWSVVALTESMNGATIYPFHGLDATKRCDAFTASTRTSWSNVLLRRAGSING